METQISCPPAYAGGSGRAQQRNSGLASTSVWENAAPPPPTPLMPDAAVPPLLSLGLWSGRPSTAAQGSSEIESFYWGWGGAGGVGGWRGPQDLTMSINGIEEQI